MLDSILKIAERGRERRLNLEFTDRANLHELFEFFQQEESIVVAFQLTKDVIKITESKRGNADIECAIFGESKNAMGMFRKGCLSAK
jgi:hypothetical protein